jgi:hypothetical protein
MNFAGLCLPFTARSLAAIATLLVLAAPAAAQTQAASGASMDGNTGLGSMTGLSLGGSGPDEATVQKRREIEQAYKDATQKIPTQAAAKNDPWANMRGPEEQKPAAKPAARTAQKKKPAQ